MKIKDVLISKDAVNDLDDGKSFYDNKETGDTLLSDIESLVIYAGIHSKKHGFYRMASKGFPYAVYYDFI